MAPEPETTDELEDGDEPLEALLHKNPAELGEKPETPEAGNRSRELIALYLQEISRVRLLTPEEEQDLARHVADRDRHDDDRVLAHRARRRRHLAEVPERRRRCAAAAIILCASAPGTVVWWKRDTSSGQC